MRRRRSYVVMLKDPRQHALPQAYDNDGDTTVGAGGSISSVRNAIQNTFIV